MAGCGARVACVNEALPRQSGGVKAKSSRFTSRPVKPRQGTGVGTPCARRSAGCRRSRAAKPTLSC